MHRHTIGKFLKIKDEKEILKALEKKRPIPIKRKPVTGDFSKEMMEVIHTDTEWHLENADF